LAAAAGRNSRDGSAHSSKDVDAKQAAGIGFAVGRE